MYGLTSEPHCLQTTNRSAPEVIVDHSKDLPTAPRAASGILTGMNLGYDQKLYILAFDHRGSFQKKFFGIEGEPDAEQTAIIADAKHLIFEGLLQAVGAGADASVTGVLVDEQFGSSVPEEAREQGLKLAMPAERSGQNMFDFQYGEDFGEHIERFDPDFTKVLVRYNPDGDARRRTASSSASSSVSATGSTRTIASSSSSCSCPPRTRSSSPSAATATATTPSCDPS